MTRYTKKVIGNIGQFAADSLKGVFKFVGDVIAKNLWIVILLFAANYAIDHKINLGFLNKVTTDDKSKLNTDEGEVAKANVYMDRNIVVIQKKDEKAKIYVGVKEAHLTKFDDDEIRVDIKDKGFGLEPGFAMVAGDGLRLGLDLEYAYWKRWGLIGGFSVPPARRTISGVRGHLGLSYDIPNKWLSHSSIFAGIDTSKTPVVGMRTKFGGGL